MPLDIQTLQFSNYVNSVTTVLLAADGDTLTAPPIDAVVSNAAPTPARLVLVDSPHAPSVIEIIEVTSVNGSYEYAISDRALEGTTAVEWPIGTHVLGNLTAGLLEDLIGMTVGAFNEVAATETTPGISERATTAEAEAGIDDARHMTPLKTKEAVDEHSKFTTKTSWAVPGEYATTQLAWDNIQTYHRIDGNSYVDIVVTGALTETSLTVNDKDRHVNRLRIRGNTDKDTDSITFTSSSTDGIKVHGSCNLQREFLKNISIYHSNSSVDHDARYALALYDGARFVCNQSSSTPRIQSIFVGDNSVCNFESLWFGKVGEYGKFHVDDQGSFLVSACYIEQANLPVRMNATDQGRCFLDFASDMGTTSLDVRRITVNNGQTYLKDVALNITGAGSSIVDLNKCIRTDWYNCNITIGGQGDAVLLPRSGHFSIDGGNLTVNPTDSGAGFRVYGGGNMTIYNCVVTGSGKFAYVANGSRINMSTASGSNLGSFTYETTSGGYVESNGSLLSGSLPS